MHASLAVPTATASPPQPAPSQLEQDLASASARVYDALSPELDQILADLQETANAVADHSSMAQQQNNEQKARSSMLLAQMAQFTNELAGCAA